MDIQIYSSDLERRDLNAFLQGQVMKLSEGRIIKLSRFRSTRDKFKERANEITPSTIQLLVDSMKNAKYIYCSILQYVALSVDILVSLCDYKFGREFVQRYLGWNEKHALSEDDTRKIMLKLNETFLLLNEFSEYLSYFEIDRLKKALQSIQPEQYAYLLEKNPTLVPHLIILESCPLEVVFMYRDQISDMEIVIKKFSVNMIRQYLQEFPLSTIKILNNNLCPKELIEEMLLKQDKDIDQVLFNKPDDVLSVGKKVEILKRNTDWIFNGDKAALEFLRLNKGSIDLEVNMKEVNNHEKNDNPGQGSK